MVDRDDGTLTAPGPIDQDSSYPTFILTPGAVSISPRAHDAPTPPNNILEAAILSAVSIPSLCFEMRRDR